ncbi:hypothetical protein HDU79_011431 [Rhizoclosmatium sp. JEL0117]|nr:hypothetical protein HDU79_011431 [Rhizoclosmatium sp. JEL0117]
MRLGKKQTKKRALANQTTPMASGRTTQKRFALGTAQMKHRSGHFIDLTGFDDDDDDGDEDGADHGQRSPAKRLRTCQTTTGTTTTIDLTKDDDDEIGNNGAELHPNPNRQILLHSFPRALPSCVLWIAPFFFSRLLAATNAYIRPRETDLKLVAESILFTRAIAISHFQV